MATLAERLTRKAARSADGCLLWTGNKQPDGYGKIVVVDRTRPRGKRTMLVHRLAYEIFVGPIPSAHDIDHLCFHRACIEPSHLRPLAPSVNRNTRARSRRRSFGELCANGHLLTGGTAQLKPNGGVACIVCARAAQARTRAKRAAKRAAKRVAEVAA